MKYSFFNFLSSKRYPVLLLLMSSFLLSGTINAKEIYFRPSVSVKTEYDDNKRLVDDRDDRFDNFDKSAFGVIARANAKVGVLSSRYGVELNNQVSIKRYISDFDLDSDDFKINLSSNYNLSARSVFGLNANYTRNTTLTSELDVDDGSGTGLVQDNIIRRQWSITPYWNYTLSQTQNIQVNYSHSEITYDESDQGSFSDYTVDFFSLSFRHQWSPLFSNTLSASVMLFDVPENKAGQVQVFNRNIELFQSRDTTEFTVNIGAEYHLSPTWLASAQVGVRFTNLETEQFVKTPTENLTLQNSSSDVQGLVFDVNIRKEFEAGDANIGFSRSTSAQGDGRLQVQDSFSANFNHKLTERLTFALSGRFSESSTSGNEGDGRDRTNYRVNPSIRWSIDKYASLSAGYTYRKQLFERNDSEAVSNAVFLTFNYQWNKYTSQKY